MDCFFHAMLDYEWSHGDDVLEWFTAKELTELIRMDEKCEKHSHEDTQEDECEHAFVVVKCLKEANPKVSDRNVLF